MARRPRNQNGPKVRNTRTVTLQIILTAADNDLSHDTEKEARRYRRGDIIDVMLTPPHATKEGDSWHWDAVLSSPRFGLVHMREVPENSWQSMRRRFTEALLEGNVPQAEATDDLAIVRRRRWRFDIPKLATDRPPKHAELMNNKETTLMHDQAMQFVYKKRYNQRDDETQDEYSLAEESDKLDPQSPILVV